MRHGISGYFIEHAANLRRLSLLAPTVALAFLGLLAALHRGPARDVIADPRHFGFEGTDEYVRRIRLESIGPVDQVGLSDITVGERSTAKGGGKAPEQKQTRGGFAEAGERVAQGAGVDDADMMARARAMRLDAPLIHSDDLVIDELVRPVYPEEAQANNVEGVVEVLALVDTTGTVQQAQIIGGTGHTMLERAATDAVLQCRYRPWRHNGRAERVYAAFRIRFSLY